MPLAVGDQLGPYEILVHIGREGWARFIAHDNKLKGDVALKILRDAFARKLKGGWPGFSGEAEVRWPAVMMRHVNRVDPSD
jgi:hypothetical protein